MKKHKILHIITYLPIGGAQDNTLITVENLDKEKYDITLMYGPQGEWVERAEALENLRTCPVHELVRDIHPVRDVIAFIKIYCHIRKEKYTIVHTHSSKPGFIGRVAARMARTPIIVHTIHGFPFHDFMPLWKQRFFIALEKTVSRISDKLITVSRLNLAKALALKLDNQEKFVNIYSGISFNRFGRHINKDRKKADLGIPAGKKIVGMIGRLSAQKAPDILIRAVPEIISAVPDVHFILAGDGELKDTLEKLIRRLNIANHVSLAGARSDVPDLLQIIDVFVVSSLWEGLGRSLTEALYMGIPAVATDVEGIPELVIPGKTGILVPPRDVPALARGVIRMLKDPAAARRMGQAGKKLVMDHFSSEKMVSDIDCLYQELLNTNKKADRHVQNS